MGEPKRSDRDDGHTLFVDQEWVLVRAMRSSTIFDDPQPPGRQVIDDAMIEQDDAVGHVPLDTVPGQTPFTALGSKGVKSCRLPQADRNNFQSSRHAARSTMSVICPPARLGRYLPPVEWLTLRK